MCIHCTFSPILWSISSVSSTSMLWFEVAKASRCSNNTFLRVSYGDTTTSPVKVPCRNSERIASSFHIPTLKPSGLNCQSTYEHQILQSRIISACGDMEHERTTTSSGHGMRLTRTSLWRFLGELINTFKCKSSKLYRGHS